MISQNVYDGNETKIKTGCTQVEPTEVARYPVGAQKRTVCTDTRVENVWTGALLTVYASCAHDATQEKPLNSAWSRVVN